MLHFLAFLHIGIVYFYALTETFLSYSQLCWLSFPLKFASHRILHTSSLRLLKSDFPPVSLWDCKGNSAVLPSFLRILNCSHFMVTGTLVLFHLPILNLFLPVCKQEIEMTSPFSWYLCQKVICGILQELAGLPVHCVTFSADVIVIRPPWHLPCCSSLLHCSRGSFLIIMRNEKKSSKCLDTS